MTARAYVLATFISRYDVGRWPTWLVGLAFVAWLALGLVGIAVTRAPWIPALWVPAAGFLLWRSAGLSLVEVLSWVVPLGGLLLAAESLSGPARQLAVGLLFVITAAFLCSGRVQAWWVMTIRQARPEDLRRLPPSAVQLISVTD